jgi:hypothetical protein
MPAQAPHSVVAEQWVCAWLRRQTVRVPSQKFRQDSERLFVVEPAEYLRRLFDDVEFSYLVVVAAELGVADLFAPGPRLIADLSAAMGADAQSLHLVLRGATDGGC